MARIAINGFGRIGRITLRNLLEKGLDVVAINDLTDNATLAHLFKYDSVQGNYAGEVSSDDDFIYIDGKKIDALSQPDPSKLPWGDMNVDVVLECTGRFTAKDKAQLHIDAGAKKVLISAPGSGGVATVVLGVNEEVLNAETKIYSNASCTTNCLAPMVKVLDDAFGVEKGLITTVHAYTADQNIQDGPHKDLRRARAAAINIVPTSTGAAKAVGLVLPHLNGKLDGGAMRVPVPTGSLTDLTVLVKKDTTLEEVDAAFKKAAENGPLKGILAYVDAPYVSSDIVGSKYSSLYDSDQTKVMGKLVKVVSWYDNEAGYSARLADLCERIAAM